LKSFTLATQALANQFTIRGSSTPIVATAQIY